MVTRVEVIDTWHSRSTLVAKVAEMISRSTNNLIRPDNRTLPMIMCGEH